MSTLKVNNIQTTAGDPNLGRVINVVQTVDSNATFLSGSGGTYRSYSGLNTTVTPLRSNSKFLITYGIKVGVYQYSSRVTMFVNGNVVLSREGNSSAYRSSSHTFFGATADASGNASIEGFDGQYLYGHSGSGSFNITFEAYAQDSNGLYINRSYTYDDTSRGRPSSFLTVMEISQ